MAYVDADHANGDEEKDPDAAPKNAMDAGAQVEYIDKIHFHRFDKREQLDVFQYREQFLGVDGVLVNGNHFLAQQQIVVMNLWYSRPCQQSRLCQSCLCFQR